jgi:hypothetical protein
MRVEIFSGFRPWNLRESGRDAVAGLTLASMNVPQVLGYTRIAAMPVVTAQGDFHAAAGRRFLLCDDHRAKRRDLEGYQRAAIRRTFGPDPRSTVTGASPAERPKRKPESPVALLLWN